MDIGSKHGYPAASLSNFAPHPFVFDDVEVASMEGLLQAFKFKEEAMQKYICSLVGYTAKKAGKFKNWRVKQTLYWKGVEYSRDGDEYQLLLDRAYEALFNQNEGFRKALAATGNSTLTHVIGRNKTNETVLTQREFCGRLMDLRNKLNGVLTFD